MDISKNNRKKKPKTEVNIFFPDELRDKKLEYGDWPKEIKEPLEEYLKTEDTKYLFQAIKANFNDILKGHGVPEAYLRYSDNTEFVDAHTIVWVSINHWQWLHIMYKEQIKISTEVERLFVNVGRSLIPFEVKRQIEKDCGEIFMHVVPKQKGESPYITYKNASKFIEYWNGVEAAFDSLKKRYEKGLPYRILKELKQEGEEDKALAASIFAFKKGLPKPKLNDIKRIIEGKLNESIELNEIQRFDYRDKSKIVASYIAWKQEKTCNICQAQNKHNLPYRTFQKLYKQAKMLS